MICWELMWEVDLVRVDVVGIVFVEIDLMGDIITIMQYTLKF